MNTLGTTYDYGSIMHYGAYTFAVDKSQPSISPKPGKARGVTMGQRLAMSTLDVERVQKLYGCTVGELSLLPAFGCCCYWFTYFS